MNQAANAARATERVELGELTRSVGFLLRLAQVQVFDPFFETLAEDGIRPGEFTVLWVIGLNPGQRQGEIASVLRIKPAHMTKLVQRMVSEGYVRRGAARDDRRAVELSLTRKGADFVAARKREFLDQFERERGRLNAAESEQFTKLLQKFIGVGGSIGYRVSSEPPQ